MAFAKMLISCPDGSAAELEVGTIADGPDALDECVRRVAVLYKVWEATDSEPEP